MKKRVISGAILLLLLIIFLTTSSKLFAMFILLCGLLGVEEFLNIKYKDKKLKVIELIAVVSFVMISLNNLIFDINYESLLLIPLLALTIPIIFYNDSDKYNINDALYVLGVVYFLGLSFGNIIYFRDINTPVCIYIFIIAFITDTYAYIGGSLIGRHKLTSISPKKTWEGTIIGTIMGCFIGSVFYYFVIDDFLVFAILLSLFLTVLSEIGDLIFSSIKRYYKVKDYSNLIPGHGGILDRFDSVIYVSLGIQLILNIF